MGREPYVVLEGSADGLDVRAFPLSLLESYGFQTIHDGDLGVLSSTWRFAGELALSPEDFYGGAVLHLHPLGGVQDVSVEKKRAVQIVLEDVVAERFGLDKVAFCENFCIPESILQYEPVLSTVYFLVEKNDVLKKALLVPAGGILELNDGKLMLDDQPVREPHIKNSITKEYDVSLVGSLNLLRRQYSRLIVYINVGDETTLVKELESSRRIEGIFSKPSQEEIDKILEDGKEVAGLEEEIGGGSTQD